jgi:phosphate transport system substrate-binding protein
MSLHRLLRASVLLLALSAATAGAGEPLRVVGSGTLHPLVERWSHAVEARDPSVAIEVVAGGSNLGPYALITGRAEVAAMTRSLNDAEREALRRRLGADPLEVAVAADAIAVFVNATNPLEHLTLEQIDAVFSSTRRCGAPAEIARWGELGLEGEWGDHTIALYGRTAVSGTYAFFRQVALCGGVFRDTVQERPGPRSTVLSIAGSRYGMGYGSRADRIDGVKALALARRAGEPYATVDAADVYSGAYPLARTFFLYLARRPSQPLDPRAADLVEEALSRKGQEGATEAGYLPLAPERIARELEELRAPTP